MSRNLLITGPHPHADLFRFPIRVDNPGSVTPSAPSGWNPSVEAPNILLYSIPRVAGKEALIEIFGRIRRWEVAVSFSAVLDTNNIVVNTVLPFPEYPTGTDEEMLPHAFFPKFSYTWSTDSTPPRSPYFWNGINLTVNWLSRPGVFLPTEDRDTVHFDEATAFYYMPQVGGAFHYPLIQYFSGQDCYVINPTISIGVEVRGLGGSGADIETLGWSCRPGPASPIVGTYTRTESAGGWEHYGIGGGVGTQVSLDGDPATFSMGSIAIRPKTSGSDNYYPYHDSFGVPLFDTSTGNQLITPLPLTIT